MHFRTSLIVVACIALLAGCIDDEERAQEYYLSAVELLESGDFDRGMIQLRNALQSDALHEEARRRFADELLAKGDVQSAYIQYVRLTEQYPNTVDVQRLLAEMALDLGDWDAVERHGMAAYTLDPALPEHRALKEIIAYNTAKTRNDLVAVQETVTRAQTLLDIHPELDTAVRLLLDWHATGPEPGNALPYIDDLLSRHPDSISLIMARLRALDALGRTADIGAGLRDAASRFPGNTEITDLLFSFYLSRNDLASAERFLREQAGPDDGAYTEHFTVVRFLQETAGTEAALAELDRLAAANPDTDLGRRYILQSQLMRLRSGERVSPETMDSVVTAMEAEDLKNDGRYLLSRVYAVSGNAAQATALIDTILTSDPAHVDALIARATEQIRAGDATSAVNNLRAALDQAPRNVQALLVMAVAQQQLGNVQLAEQRLAQAFEVSNAAPDPSLAYAQFQINNGNLPSAERALNDSLTTNGIDLRVAALLADVRMSKDDLPGARRLLSQLIAADIPEADELVRGLQSTILLRENRVEESLDYLRSSLEDAEGDLDETKLMIELQILQIHLFSRQYNDARSQIDDLLERFPDEVALRIIEANLLSLEGRTDDAIAAFEQILETNPDQVIAYRRLYNLLRENGRPEEATAVLNAGLERLPDQPSLQIFYALELENSREIGSALGVYEKLHANDPSNFIVSNNYASMLAYYGENDADVDRAEAIITPFMGNVTPAFLDTVGFIKMRQGDHDGAIVNFQAAARALPNNPTVAFNLGEAYALASRTDEARAELERGLILAGDRTDIPRLTEARALLDQLGSDAGN